MTGAELRERRNEIAGQPKPIKIERRDFVRIIGEPMHRYYVAGFAPNGNAVLSDTLTGFVRNVPVDELRYSPALDK